MNHEQYKEWIPLYDELDGHDLQELESHLQGCPECTAELAAMKKFKEIVEQNAPPTPSLDLLNEARLQLRGALSVQRSRRPLWNVLMDFINDMVLPRYKLALGGAAMVGAGVLIGFLI